MPDPRSQGLRFLSRGEGYCHKDAPEEKHKDEIGFASAEGALFQHAAVAEPAAMYRKCLLGGVSVSPLPAAPSPAGPPPPPPAPGSARRRIHEEYVEEEAESQGPEEEEVGDQPPDLQGDDRRSGVGPKGPGRKE